MTAEQHSPWQLSDLACLLLSEAAQSVVGHWLADKRFRDDCDAPRLLFMAGHDNDSFASLVDQAGLQGQAMAILDELIKVGLVLQDLPDGLLLSHAAYTPTISVEWYTMGFAITGENR